MPTPTHTPSAATARAGTAHTPHHLSVRAFTGHFLEMVVAMAVGMVALHPVWTLVLDAFGATGLMDDPYTGSLIMATDMTVAMSAWMRFRGHRWRPIAEMGAAMYLPFLVLFVPLALGLIGEGALML